MGMIGNRGKAALGTGAILYGLAIALLTTTAIGVAQAQQTAKSSRTGQAVYSLPPGSLGATISRFGDRANLQILYPADLVRGKMSAGLSGSYNADAALTKLLQGSGLSYSFTNANTVTIVPAVQADAAALAAVAPGSTILQPITVQGQGAFAHVDGYVAQSASTAMKGDIPLLETPQAVSVVTSDQIKEQGAQSINEALRYTAGVRAEVSGAQALDNPLYLRGFNQSSLDMYQDGLRAVTPGYFGFFAGETYGLERVEVLKGPSSVLYGQQIPGGLINSVSKRPSDAPIREVELTAGSFDQYQAAFDIGGTNADKNVMYRIVGMARDADTQVDYVKNDRTYIAPSISWVPDEDTKLTVLTSYQKNKGDFYAQVPATAVLLPNSYGHIPFNRFLGEPSWEYEESERLALGYEFEHRFNDNVKFEQNFRYTHLTNHRQYLQANGALVGERRLNRRFIIRDIENDGVAIDNRVRLDFDTGPLEHKAVVGLDYLWGKSHWLEQSGTGPSIDIFNPVYASSFTPGVLTSNALSDIDASQAGVYFQDQIKYDKWLLTLGARQDWAWRDTDNLRTNITTSQDDSAFTKRAGLTYLSDIGLAPYISYSQSFTPILGNDRLGDAFVPETSEQYEVGVKFQPAGYNSFITVSAFDLARQNVQTIDPVNTSFQIQTGEVRVRGLELEALASLDNGLSFTAAYTYNDAEITKTNTASQKGNTPYRVPTHAASLWGNYAFQSEAFDGLTMGAGVRYIGKTWGDDANTFQVPSFTLVDAAVSYDFGKKFEQAKGLTASLNVTNLFDKYYVPACFTANACNYGSSRTVIGKLNYRW